MKFHALTVAFSLLAGVLAEDMAMNQISEAPRFKIAIKCKILQAKGICGNPCRLKRGIDMAEGLEDMATICKVCRVMGGLIKCAPRSGPGPIPRPIHPPRPSPPSLPSPPPPSPPAPEEEEEEDKEEDREPEEKEPKETEPEEQNEEQVGGDDGEGDGGQGDKKSGGYNKDHDDDDEGADEAEQDE
ncbi:hypothetical protein L249_2022 [Ophiocordyceps polyrhachis-furcata BCC 54312]|uniref:Uncharacterized protein n=1 Tax=Ophiocordyceps polyrhachis-furcata BCC 54312 TaxID=1330021 RepID=A0A367LRF3_9HYPO|nr:hypothetical protein L249_2022 [Ophiocordyceps polyrhachis-furcata BCC 54312]